MRAGLILLTVALAAGLGATLGSAAAREPTPGFQPPARPADVPAEDWPFSPSGALKRGGNLDISTPTAHVLRHGGDVEVTTPTVTYVQHGTDITISTPTMTMSKHGADIVISTPTGTTHQAADDGDDDDDAAEAKPATHHHSSSSSSGSPVIGLGVIALCAYFARKAWRRRRRRPFDAMARPAYRPRMADFDPRGRERVPGDGAAEAVLEQLLRLERRLAMIETAVTSSEFELQRGFSALEPGRRS